MESVKDRIIARCEHLGSMVEQIQNKIQAMPVGNVYTKHIGDKVYYYRYEGDNSKEKLLGANDKKLVEDLLQKRYLNLVLNYSKRELTYLKKILSNYPIVTAEDTYNMLAEEHKDIVRPVILSDEQYVNEWQNRPYTPKPFAEGDPYYLTMRGERVRSKSEVLIADRLFINGIPYKYECPIRVGNEIFHPDFTILRVSDRKILYLEHNGKVGDPKYGDDMVDRINKYEMAGIYQNDRLYFTFESANRPLDVRVVDKMINDLFR